MTQLHGPCFLTSFFYPTTLIIFIHQYMVDMQKIIMIQQTKNLNNLTEQNVCVQYAVLQRYIFQTVCI